MLYEELKKKKSKKIKEWFEYLINNSENDVRWEQKNRVYASSIPDYLYLMQEEKKDHIIERQCEIVQPVTTYINELNREKVYNIVKELRDLEDGNKSKFEKNGILYSETKTDLNNDIFDSKITDENLKAIIDEVINNNQQIIGNNALNWNKTVHDLMKKIIDLPNGTTTTIANLISYNPNEEFVEPLTQGTTSFIIKKVCKKLNIELESTKDKIDGLAYYNEFKKVNNDKFV